MQINDLSARITANHDLIRGAVDDVLKSGWFVLGPQLKKFESAFAEYNGVLHCIGVANGTDAIELALKSLGVSRGDLVATTANAGMYSTNAITALGAKPFFLDVDFATRNTSLEEVSRALQSGVKAVIVTHLYGLAVPDIQEISHLCARAGIPLLEDCAQAHGARVGLKRVGSFGDAASFSFYPTKNLGALGDGGAVITDRSDVAEKVSQLRQYGWTSKYKTELSGGRNSRLDELQAAILLSLLPRLDAANDRRRQIAERYNSGIRHTLVIPPFHSGPKYVAHLFVVSSPQRDLLKAHLLNQDIGCEVHYPIPDHKQPVFADRYNGLILPHTEELSGEILTLPCYPELTDADVDRVIETINEWQP